MNRPAWLPQPAPARPDTKAAPAPRKDCRTCPYSRCMGRACQHR